MSSLRHGFVGAAMLAVLTVTTGSAPRGPQYFFIYSSGCNATVIGEIKAWAGVQGADFYDYNSNTVDISRRFAIDNSQGLRFEGSGSASASAEAVGHEGCTVEAKAGTRGSLTYSFQGDQTAMDVRIGSARRHSNTIRRDVGRYDSVALAESSWGMPGYDTVDLTVPFVVGGGNGGYIVIDQFSIRRADSGDTQGTTRATWTIFSNIDGGCSLDRTDQVFATGALFVGANGGASADPIRFESPRGNYILVVEYDTLSYLSTYSVECGQSAQESSTVEDAVTLLLSIH